MSSTVVLAAPCEVLWWDTKFFHCRIGRVCSDTLDDATALEIDDWSRAEAIQALYFLARADSPETVRTAERHGFGLVDVRVVLERRAEKQGGACTPEPASELAMRLAEPEDVPGLQAIARKAHANSRFFNDPHFSCALSEELYATWIALECQGRAQAVFVAADPGNQPQGYISCHLDPAGGEGQIDLLGVSEKMRGQGLGQRLVRTALGWLEGQGASLITVVTQGRNLQAQRLYQRCGFITRDLRLWYHKWYSPL
jgi:dTDP-4-amino-4,6-dideoxy-D-galactose acyltransferase